MRKIVAKLKVWFGADEPIFDTKNYDVEYNEDKTFVYIYKKDKE